MPGKPIAVQGCTILINGGVIQPPGPLIPVTPPDSNILAGGMPCYFGDLQVIVPSGTSGPAGVMSAPVPVTIKATGMNVKNSTGVAVLMGDQSMGTDMGSFVAGTVTTSVPLLLTIMDAGQTDVLVG